MKMEQPKFPDGKTAKKIAAKFETPCYVYDEASLVKQAKAALAFPNAFGLTVRYAMKAASNAAILKLFDKLGLHIDASQRIRSRTRNPRGNRPHPHFAVVAAAAEKPERDCEIGRALQRVLAPPA